MSDEIRSFTVAELAEDAFLKQEHLHCLMMMNTPIDFEDRKKAFVQLALAREAANKARIALDSLTNVLPKAQKPL